MTYKSQGEYTTKPRAVNDRLDSIERRMDSLIESPLGRVIKVYSEPDRPRDGHYVYADGTQWNPGSGKGIYIYDGSSAAWVQWVAL